MSTVAVGRQRDLRIAALRASLGAAALWTVIEFGVRNVAFVALVMVVRGSLSVTDQALPGMTTLYFALLSVTLLILGAVFYRRARREHLGWSDLGYRFSWRALLAGAITGVALVWFAHALDVLVLERFRIPFFVAPRADEAQLLRIVSAGGLPTIVLLLLSNVVLGPPVEEFAWRGYIQTRLARDWSPRGAVVVTAVLFALKHVVVDLTVGRAGALLFGSLILSLIRQRWGTGASTATHLTENLTSTVSFAIAALKV